MCNSEALASMMCTQASPVELAEMQPLTRQVWLRAWESAFVRLPGVAPATGPGSTL